MMNTTATVRIYTRTGCRNVTNSPDGDGLKYFVCGYPKEKDTPGDWTLRYNGTLTGLGQGFATPMPAINLAVPANTTLGVYISSRTFNGRHMYHTSRYSGYTSPGMPTPAFASDDYIRIHEGLSESLYGNYAYPTLWNGKEMVAINSITFDDMKILLD